MQCPNLQNLHMQNLHLRNAGIAREAGGKILTYAKWGYINTT